MKKSINISKSSVGVLTIHDIYNYGSVLQAYATVRSLQKLEFVAEIIDYKYPNSFHLAESPRIGGKILTKANSFLKDLLPGRPYSTYVGNYKNFRTRHIPISKNSYASCDQIIQDPPLYDTYLAGSDQIWRPERMKADPVFFLGFGNAEARRVSYASSFGCTDIPQSFRKVYSKYLDAFDHLSVREVTGVKLIKDLTGRDAKLVLDPTLLLSPEEWSALAEPPPFQRPYLVCYGFHPNSRYMERMARDYADRHNLDIVRINGSFIDYFSRGIQYVLNAGPAEWLGLIRDSSVVFAQSFHASVFAALFRRPFYSILRGDAHHDSRQISLLELASIPYMAITVGDDYRLAIADPPLPDYDRVHSNLSKVREVSINYLKTSLTI
jgi:hypothetical protein